MRQMAHSRSHIAGRRRAKIVATVGPASSTPAMLRALVEAGADVFRLNFSHGHRDEHAAVLRSIRDIETQIGRPIGVIQDLQGPKIRIGEIPGGVRQLFDGEVVTIVPDARSFIDAAIVLPHPEVFSQIEVGNSLRIDDGRVELRVISRSDLYLQATVLAGGPVSSRKGVNLPDSDLDLAPLTEKDRADLQFGLENGIEWVALSFVQRPDDLTEARKVIGSNAKIIAKIEKPLALKNIQEIVELADAIMIARGDLGVEIPPEDVPFIQKRLVRLSRSLGRPIIVATQMLDSMTSRPTPTRAETTDVATAIYDGADAVMLSAETASGKYPREAVAMMDRIVRQTESHLPNDQYSLADPEAASTSVARSIAFAATTLAESLGAKAIVTLTESGFTAENVAQQRPSAPILAVTPSLRTARQLQLVWGAEAFCIPGSGDPLQSAKSVVSERCRETGASVLVWGTAGARGGTDSLRVLPNSSS